MPISTVEKVAKKFTRRKLEGWELLYIVLKGKKVHNFYIFMQITLLVGTFLHFFWIWNQIKFCVFWQPMRTAVSVHKEPK